MMEWIQITDDLNKTFSTNRTVEGVKKHFRKLKYKYYEIKSCSNNSWGLFNKFQLIDSESQNDYKINLQKCNTTHSINSMSQFFNDVHSSQINDNLIAFNQYGEKQKRSYEQTNSIINLLSKRIKSNMETENEILDIMKKMTR